MAANVVRLPLLLVLGLATAATASSNPVTLERTYLFGAFSMDHMAIEDPTGRFGPVNLNGVLFERDDPEVPDDLRNLRVWFRDNTNSAQTPQTAYLCVDTEREECAYEEQFYYRSSKILLPEDWIRFKVICYTYLPMGGDPGKPVGLPLVSPLGGVVWANFS